MSFQAQNFPGISKATALETNRNSSRTMKENEKREEQLGALPAEYDVETAIILDRSWIDADGGMATDGEADEVVAERDYPREARTSTGCHVAEINGRRSCRRRSEDLCKRVSPANLANHRSSHVRPPLLAVLLRK
ncbi:hypothetical protein SO802_005445 [Lithocarpus litseifolius]|uniref:Uncharacterized protein n=1 Tax=Lithocarpus litseifolius TaxID=425828 RepID=A0AAW2DKQ4_9ROSI